MYIILYILAYTMWGFPDSSFDPKLKSADCRWKAMKLIPFLGGEKNNVK